MRKVLIVFACIGLHLSLFSQDLKIGVLSGTNFSDIHGLQDDSPYFRWKTKKGPVSGLFASYSLNRLWEINSEFNFTTLYYQRMSDDVYSMDFYDGFYPSYSNYEFEYNFYRFPVYLKFSTTNKLRFQVSIGGYFSFLESYEKNNPFLDFDPPSKDWGYFYSAGISYNLNRNTFMFFSGRYFSGRKEFEMTAETRLASYELTVGIGYSGFLKNEFKPKKHGVNYDTINNKLYLKYKFGVANSKIKTNANSNYYTGKSSISAGVSLKYKFDKTTSIISEILYTRKGYNYKDSSSLNYRHYENGLKYYVNTKTDIDYVEIPVLLNKDFGKRYLFYLSSGPYFGFVIDAKNAGNNLLEYSTPGYYTAVENIVYQNIEDKFSNYDWGWQFNVGILIPLKDKYKFDFEFRYNLGLMNILNESDIQELNDDYMKNRSLGIYIGFLIPFI